MRGDKIDMNPIEKLKMVKSIEFILLMISISFIAFGPHYLAAILFILFSVIINRKYYKCPHCNKNLDTRMKLTDETHCPFCGKVISQANRK